MRNFDIEYLLTLNQKNNFSDEKCISVAKTLLGDPSLTYPLDDVIKKWVEIKSQSKPLNSATTIMMDKLSKSHIIVWQIDKYQTFVFNKVAGRFFSFSTMPTITGYKTVCDHHSMSQKLLIWIIIVINQVGKKIKKH